MSKAFGSMVVVSSVLAAALAAAPACQCGSEVPIDKTEHTIALTSEMTDGKIAWKKIEPISVRGGDTIRVTVEDHTAWFLIPDDRFRLLEGGSDWVASKSFTAFKVENGYAVISLEECSSDPEPREEIHYSVLVRHASGPWEYVHGTNPPPRMTVPPRR